MIIAPVCRIALGVVCLFLSAGTVAAEATEPDEPRTDPAAPGSGPGYLDEATYVEVRAPYAPTSNTIATKLPVPALEIPANVGSVGAALLREQGAAVLTDALGNVSGLNVEAGLGVFDYFLLRGFNSLDGGLVLTDGAAEPEVGYYAMYNVEGVEVFKGPAGFLYGGNPLAGAVNIIRKQPLPGQFAVFDLAGGTFGTFDGRADWNTASRDGARSFRVNGLWRESDGFRDDMESRHRAVNPGFTWRLGEDRTLNVNVEYLEADYQPDSGIPLLSGALPDVPREQSYQTPFDFSEQQVLRLQVDYETRLSEHVRLRNKTYHRELDWLTDGTLLVGALDLPPEFGGPIALRSFTGLDDLQRVTGNRLEAIFELGAGRVRHDLLVGLEVSRATDDFDLGVALPCQPPFVPPACVQPIAIFDPVETSAGVTPFPFLVGRSTTEVWAPYVVDRIRFSELFQLLVGARYDDASVDVDYDANLQEPVAGYDRDDSELSPMAGVVVAPAPGLSLYANAGRAFAPHGARVLGAGELDPEQSTQYEVGAKTSFRDGKARASIAAYEVERENIPISDDNGLTQQAGDQRSRGVELELAAEFRPRLRTLFSYAYNDAELTRFSERVVFGPGPTDFIVVDRSGNAPAFAPEHLASVWVSQSFAGGLGVAGGLRYVSGQFIAEDNLYRLDDYLTVDAAVYYDFPSVRLKLNLRNLTDEEYERRGFGGASVTPAPGLSFVAGVECRL